MADAFVWTQCMPVAQVGFGSLHKGRVHELMRFEGLAVVQVSVFKVNEANASVRRWPSVRVPGKTLSGRPKCQVIVGQGDEVVEVLLSRQLVVGGEPDHLTQNFISRSALRALQRAMQFSTARMSDDKSMGISRIR